LSFLRHAAAIAVELRRLARSAVVVAAITSIAQPVFAQADAYKLHMKNGVKLFHDENYDAAIAEFRAAYEAKPKASPLVNIALAEKAQFKYPQAIEALELALAKHKDTMDAADVQAAEAAIKEMRALLAYIEIDLFPPEATLFVDGDELAKDAAKSPIPLGPGTHKIVARAEGYAPAEENVTVASGETEKLKLALVPDRGWVAIEPTAPNMNIAIDQRVVGSGKWAGLLSPGTHLVQVYGPGAPSYSAQILVVAGKQLHLRPSAPAPLPTTPLTVVPVPPPPTQSKKQPPPRPPRRGFYAIALGGLLFPTTHPQGFEASVNSGASGGVRVGYQVNNTAGFDLLYEHASIFTPSAFDSVEGYTLISNRIGLELRLATHGDRFRFIGMLGSGLTHDMVTFDKTELNQNPCGPACIDASGWDPFFLLEGGMEFDIEGVLLGVALQSIFQPSRGISPETTNDIAIFDNEPLIHLGPALRVGYRFW